MSQKPYYHRQTAKFIAVITECVPEIPSDVMQKWIHNPKELKAALERALYPKSIQKPLLIDTDVIPFIPYGWSIGEHQKGGLFEWSGESYFLLLTKKQASGAVKGSQLQETLSNVPVLNACVLDYLIDNPHLIPEEWKAKKVFFWGTTYLNLDGVTFVRYLYNSIGGRWYCGSYWVGLDFSSDEFAACSHS
jgi:hypothetical protein